MIPYSSSWHLLCFLSSILFPPFISSFYPLSWVKASQGHQPLCMAVNSICEVLLEGPISSGVDVVPSPSEKDSYSLFPVDGKLIQLHFLKNRSLTLCKFILSHAKNFWHLQGLNPSLCWKQI